MTTIKEFNVSSIGEPCQVKIERGQKGGYGYEINMHGESMPETLGVVLEARRRLEAVLYGADQPIMPEVQH